MMKNFNMERLINRILIAYEEGGEIAYLYNREAFGLLEVEKQKWDESQFLEIGNIINYQNQKFEIVDINFKLYKEISKVDNNLGINLYSPTDLSDYNCQVGIFVKAVK